jgi:hypothetical protein
MGSFLAFLFQRHRVATVRILWALVVGAVLVGVAISALWLADAYESEATKYCSVRLTRLQWLGCAMAAHEDLAAGLIGAAGALFAGWLAFQAVQEQMRQEREREFRTERPWLFLKGATITRRESPGQSPHPNNWYIRLLWRNVGRSPAIIERCEFNLSDKTAIPTRVNYQNSMDLSAPSMIPQDAEFETNDVGPAPTATDVTFVFYGRLTYRSLSGAVHHTGFALEVAPRIAAFSKYEAPSYNYYN